MIAIHDSAAMRICRQMQNVVPCDSIPRSKLLRWDATLDKAFGYGVRVALLDSGLDFTQPALAQARIQARDFTGSGQLFDPSGHGTSNALLLVGQGSVSACGLVPECELLFAKVLDHHDRRRTNRAITRALSWVIHMGASVIVMPFGASCGSTQIRVAVGRAYKAGANLFAAAGNRDPDRLCFPACVKSVTAVSALSRSGSVLEDCCRHQEVNLYCWADDVPVPGLIPVVHQSGSSPACVIAAAMEARRQSIERNATACNGAG